MTHATAYQASVAAGIRRERQEAIDAGRREHGDGYIDTIFWTGCRWVGDRYQSGPRDHADDGPASVATACNMARRLAPGGGCLKKTQVSCAANVEHGEEPGDQHKSRYHLRFRRSRIGQVMQDIRAFAIVAA